MTTTPFRILCAEAFDGVARARLRAVATVVSLASCDEASIAESVAGCDALLVRTASQVTRRVIGRADRLKVIGRGGVGLENIDLFAARERGIEVVYTPAAATEAVADLTLGLMLSLIRRIPECDRATREGRFDEARHGRLGLDLCDMTIGIVGLGRIGKAVARRCALGFGMNVLFNDIVDPGPLGFPARPCAKFDLYHASDVVSLHVPLTDQTRRLIDVDALGEFRDGAYLINTARGGVVDGVALAEALALGKLGGAGLDVFEPEPLPPGHPLWSAPYTVFTPHSGARTTAGLRRMNDVVEDVIRVLQGKKPIYRAEPETEGPEN